MVFICAASLGLLKERLSSDFQLPLMVDYSKFDHIQDSSSDEADHVSLDGAVQAFTSLDGAKCGFRYPLKGGPLVNFDVDDATCAAFGYKHGDVVITPEGVVSTAIGVHNGRLFFHMEGARGAGLWQDEKLTKVGWATVKEGSKEAPSLKSDWLTLDFCYTAGPEGTALAFFDTRDEMCMRVGGFQHGQVLRIQGLPQVVTIGVKRKESGRLFLWFRVKGTRGLALFKCFEPFFLFFLPTLCSRESLSLWYGWLFVQELASWIQKIYRALE